MLGLERQVNSRFLLKLAPGSGLKYSTQKWTGTPTRNVFNYCINHSYSSGGAFLLSEAKSLWAKGFQTKSAPAVRREYHSGWPKMARIMGQFVVDRSAYRLT